MIRKPRGATDSLMMTLGICVEGLAVPVKTRKRQLRK